MDEVRGLMLLTIAACGCGRIGFDNHVADSSAPLTVSVSPTRANLSSNVDVSVAGGSPPYTLSTSGGTLDDTARKLRTPSNAGTVVVTATDQAGDTATASVSCGGDFIYVVGGFDTAAHDEVWRTADGVQWTVVGRLPAARTSGELVVFDDQLFYFGGWRDQPDGIPTNTAWSSPDGATWSSIGTLPQVVAAARGVAYLGRIWLIGGITTGQSYTSTVLTSSNGITWSTEAPLPFLGHEIVVMEYRDQLWTVAGHHDIGQSDALHVSSDGAAWTALTGKVPAPGEYNGVAVHANRLWVAGGVGLRARVVSTADGITWTDAAPMPAARDYLSLLSFKDELWIVSGKPAETLHSVDGTMWTSLPAFPRLLEGVRAVQFTPR
jgi:hypothetical protein